MHVRKHGWAYRWEAEMILVGDALGPMRDFLIRLKVVPCLSTFLVEQSPSGVIRLHVSFFILLRSP